MENIERPTIMLVDDNEDLLLAMSFLLERYGFNVDARTSPPNWVVLKAIQPALLFLDVELTPHNGVNICKSIKENLTDLNLPIVLISGHSADQLLDEARYCHADAILTKPFDSGSMKRLAEHFTRGSDNRFAAR